MYLYETEPACQGKKFCNLRFWYRQVTLCKGQYLICCVHYYWCGTISFVDIVSVVGKCLPSIFFIKLAIWAVIDRSLYYPLWLRHKLIKHHRSFKLRKGETWNIPHWFSWTPELLKAEVALMCAIPVVRVTNRENI